MDKLPLEKCVQILHMLVEGSSMRAIARAADVSFNTFAKLLKDGGMACATYHDEHVRDVRAQRLQRDEIYSLCYAKAKNFLTAKRAPSYAGDVWTWTALDADSKLIVPWLVGGRDAEYANEFMQDTADRLANRVQLTTDGHSAYLNAVEGVFGIDVDFAQLVKIHGSVPTGRDAATRSSPPACVGARKGRFRGDPDPDHISTSYAERQNLNIRMHIRSFTRLTNAFSKKIKNHCHALALYFVFYNFVRVHSTLRVTPAMAAGVTDGLWDMGDIVALIDARESAPKKCGPYKKRIAN